MPHERLLRVQFSYNSICLFVINVISFNHSQEKAEHHTVLLRKGPQLELYSTAQWARINHSNKEALHH